jgi:hypothetical protein
MSMLDVFLSLFSSGTETTRCIVICQATHVSWTIIKPTNSLIKELQSIEVIYTIANMSDVLMGRYKQENYVLQVSMLFSQEIKLQYEEKR